MRLKVQFHWGRNLREISFFLINCVFKDALVNFLEVILFENVPKRTSLCIRENPGS